MHISFGVVFPLGQNIILSLIYFIAPPPSTPIHLVFMTQLSHPPFYFRWGGYVAPYTYSVIKGVSKQVIHRLKNSKINVIPSNLFI
jgi:hypothetical protein